jgi:hypothetical protein
MCRSCEARAGWHAEMICLVWRLREQARSHIGFVNRLIFRDLTQAPVGASLLARALDLALSLLDVPTLSEQARSYNGAGSLTTRNASTTSENAGDGWRRLG